MAEPEGFSNQTLKLKNRLIYNFVTSTSGIPKPSTHPHIFKLPVMPEMDDI